MEPITDRQQLILSRVIDTHIDTAQPVGSRTLRDRYELQYSPATLRAEMGHLEERGFLEQRHTSSGRVPTDLGYRYYVDHDIVETGPETGTDFSHVLPSDLDAVDILTDEASRLLSLMSEEAGIVYVRDPKSLGERSRQGRPRMAVHGSSHLLSKPEFQDVQKLRSLFDILEEKMKLAEWIMGEESCDHVSIRIGRENKPEALQDCSVVLTHYHFSGEPLCAVAVLGPRRMRYRQAVPLVDRMAKAIGELLNKQIGF